MGVNVNFCSSVIQTRETIVAVCSSLALLYPRQVLAIVFSDTSFEEDSIITIRLLSLLFMCSVIMTAQLREYISKNKSSDCKCISSVNNIHANHAGTIHSMMGIDASFAIIGFLSAIDDGIKVQVVNEGDDGGVMTNIYKYPLFVYVLSITMLSFWTSIHFAISKKKNRGMEIYA